MLFTVCGNHVIFCLLAKFAVIANPCLNLSEARKSSLEVMVCASFSDVYAVSAWTA